MKNIITDLKTLLVAIIGLIGGSIWAAIAHWEPEPMILVIGSIIEILAFGILRSKTSNDEPPQLSIAEPVRNDINVNVSVGNIEKSNNSDKADSEQPTKTAEDREAIIELMKSKTKILFIDDDKNFNVVKILKNGGWRLTKSVIDVKSIDIPVVKDSHIHFVDINGVGKLLSLTHEGLDLALMIKQRYPDKKVIIYSANRNSNSFHQAWDVCDFKLEKNALPSQFQALVEQHSIELYNKIK